MRFEFGDGFSLFAFFCSVLIFSPPGSCLDISDMPLDARVRAAPANIVFLLDDSGSMDSEFMTNEHNGLFRGYQYVFSIGDNVYSGALDWLDKRRWKSQWAVYNRMYYDPKVDYEPWPTLDNADPNIPRSHPVNQTPTFNLTSEYFSIGNEVILDNIPGQGFSKSDGWKTWASGTDYGDDYHYISDSEGNNWATWTPNLPRAGNYEVFAWWVSNSNRRQDGSYTIFHNGKASIVTGVNQQKMGGPWNSLGTFYFTQGDLGHVRINATVGGEKTYCADAMMFLPEGSASISIKNAHYYLWSDKENRPYLVVLDRSILYYEVNDSDSDEVVEPGELLPTTSPPADVQSDRTYAEERQNFANWYSFYRRRELTATAATGKVIANMQGVQVGIRSISGNLIQPVLKVKVQGEDESDTLLNTLYSLSIQAQNTPLRKRLQDVGKYFHQDDGETGGIGISPYASAADGGACQQAFAIIMTCGNWNGYDPNVGNIDGDNGRPFADGYSDTLADVAMYYYENDLSSDLDDLLPGNRDDDAIHQHMVTYAVSFGVLGTLNPSDYDFDGDSFPPWPNPYSGDREKIDDLWHAAVNGRGAFLSTSNPWDLVSSMHAIMQNIESRIGSASSVSINVGKLYWEIEPEVFVFQSSYHSNGWTGDVKAYQLNPETGEVAISSYMWSAADALEGLNWNSRIMATYNGSKGTPFRLDSLTNRQKTLLDKDWIVDDTRAGDRLAFLRGDTSNEEKNGGPFRNRFGALGDMVHSSPVYEKGILYVGGNDGMLHAFDVANGSELFAYVPDLVFENLKRLTVPDYSHTYYVDLTPAIKTGVGLPGKNEITLLVGGLGKGGKGYFALDISDPLSITSESALAEKVMWEYSGDDDLGYSYSIPAIVDSKAGWIVVFGNGYNSAEGDAVLFILNPSDGTPLRKIEAGSGSCNGLSTPVLIDVDYDNIVDYVYAGDLKGNLWKFDLTDNSYTNWDVAYKDGTTPKPLFQAKGKGHTAQPITAKPDVMSHCKRDGFLVVFGTGKYLEDSDLSDVGTQTIYGVWDYGDADDDSEYLGSFNRGSARELSNQPNKVTLLEQTEVDWRLVNEQYMRTLSNHDPKWKTMGDPTDPTQLPGPSNADDNHVGWYFDFPISGERVVSDVMIRDGKAIVISFAPEEIPCSTGGHSIIHEIDVCTGGRLAKPQIDINKDRAIDRKDLVEGKAGDSPFLAAPTGIQKAGRLHPPVILKTGKLEQKLFSSSNGDIVTERGKAARLGITYWMELW